MEDRCVCCGKIIPEGRQVCWHCENEVRCTKKLSIGQELHERCENKNNRTKSEKIEVNQDENS